jgi:hypothetical protein
MKNQNNNPNKIVVNVKITLGEQFQVNIKRDASIQNLKQKVKKIRGLPVNSQIIIFEGRHLENTDLLNSLLPATQSELNLLLLVNTQIPKKNKQKDEEPQINEKAPPQTFTFQPLPVEFYESSQAPILKISYEDQHRRVQFADASYLKLIELCTYFFGVKNPHRMVICYKDEDSDMIQISSDAELQYALTYHTNPTQNGLKILKLFFSVKQKKKTELSVESVQEQQSHDSNSSKTLQEGAVVLLTTQQEGNKLYLSLLGNKVVGSIEESQNAHWIVENAPQPNNNEQSSSQVILLSNPLFTSSKKKSHLRVAASGRVDHNGANGNYARFQVEYLPNGQIKLRSVGRSTEYPNHCSLGLVKKQATNTTEFVGVGDLPEDAPEAHLNVQFVSKTQII